MSSNLALTKILYLEKSAPDAKLVIDILERNSLNFHVEVVNTRNKYTTALKEYQPDIILSEDNLPHFNSEEAFGTLKELGLQIPFIIVSGNISDEFALHMYNKGVDDFILKPGLGRLVIAIKNILAKYRLEQEKLNLENLILKSKHRFKRLIETGTDVVFILSPAGKVEYISPSVEKHFGVKVKDVLQNSLVDILNPETPELLRDSILKCIEDPEANSLDFQISFNDKEPAKRWFSVNLKNLITDPEVQGIIGLFHDITDEKNIQLQIKESELKYRSFFDNSLDGILLTGTNGDVYAANSAACKMFGMTEAEICALGRKGLCDLNDPRLKKALEQRKTDGSIRTEINMIRKDGSVVPVEMSSAVFQMENEAVPRTSMIIRDISDNKKILSQLQKSEERYKSLFSFNPLPVFMFNENTLEIIDVNPAACNHYGYTKEEFVGMLLQQIRPSTEVGTLKKVMKKNQADNLDSWQTSAVHRKKDGSIIDVEINGHRFFIDNNSCVIGVCNDVTEKKQNLEKLKESTQKLKIAEKIAKLGYWEHNFSNNSIYCSDEIFSIYGFEKDEAISLEKFKGHIHPDDLSIFLKEQDEVLKGEKDHDIQYRIISKDNTVKWVHARAEIIKNHDGEMISANGTLQDITSDKKITEELVKSEARYRGLFYSQTNYFVRINMQGNYTYCNHKFQEEFGWLFPDGNPEGHNALIDVMEYNHKEIKDITKEMLTSPNKTFQMEMDKHVPDGEPKTTLWDMTYLKDENGVGEIQSVGIDISSRVKVIRENRFQADLLNKIGQGIIAVDEEGKVTYWNRAAEKMYGWKTKEALSRNLEDLLSPENKCFFQEDIQLQLKAGENVNGEEVVAGKNGIILPIQFILSPILNDAKKLEGFICVASDISNLKKSEIELKKLNKELSDYTKELVSANEGLEQFSYIVSHNLRAPVANIMGIANLLETDDNPKPMEDLLKKEMFDNVGRLDGVVRDLKYILNVKSNFTQKMEWIDLTSLIDDIIASNKNTVEKLNVSITTDFASVGEIKTVKSYLYSILFNLISNSVKYRQKGVTPVISIRSEAREGQILLTIEDNGMGIDLSKKKEQLFGLYKRFHTHVEGKGMGLFMVKTQVQILGGSIRVESTPGVGSKFIISLKSESDD